jgi:hypothetical protein
MTLQTAASIEGRFFIRGWTAMRIMARDTAEFSFTGLKTSAELHLLDMTHVVFLRG